LAHAKLLTHISTHATNLLASAIEEFGGGHNPVIDALLDVYLSKPDLKNIDALVLACTHYPIIKDQIKLHCKKSVTVIDSSEIVAAAVEKQLEKNKLLNQHGASQKHFYVSDYTESFADKAKLFFGDNIKLEHYPLWD
jgi:glutamate racemase